MREDSTSLAGHSPLTESGKRNKEDMAGLLAMVSKRVWCSPFLPTTESDRYSERERERESESDIQRESVSERTSFREIEIEREQISERKRECTRAK